MPENFELAICRFVFQQWNSVVFFHFHCHVIHCDKSLLQTLYRRKVKVLRFKVVFLFIYLFIYLLFCATDCYFQLGYKYLCSCVMLFVIFMRQLDFEFFMNIKCYIVIIQQPYTNPCKIVTERCKCVGQFLQQVRACSR